MSEKENKKPDYNDPYDKNPDIKNQQSLDDIMKDPGLIEKILAEKGIKLPEKDTEEKARINIEAISVIMNGLVFFVLGIFITSPFIQLFCRVIDDLTDSKWNVGVSGIVDNRKFINNYQHMIGNINALVCLTAAFLYIMVIYKVFTKRKKIFGNIKKYLSAALPFIIFLMFSVSIIVVTCIRGFNEFDKKGHPYMNESIYSYMLYPLSYFFCGLFVWKSSYKKILLYALIFTAFPLNILALYNEWVGGFLYFRGSGVVAVFHNSNHYGYYLAMVLFTSGILFVIEEKIWRRIVSLISMIVATIVLIINNTLGAYLAVSLSFVLFIIYSILSNRRKRGDDEKTGSALVKHKGFLKKIFWPGGWQCAILILVIFIGITVLMSRRYNTVGSSVSVMVGDVGDILSDPMENDKAGSGRWRLWKGAVRHIVEEPLLGFGVEGLLTQYEIGTPHNEILQYAEFFGVITTALYILAVWLVMWRVFRNFKKMSKSTMLCFFACFTYLASSFFGVAIYYTTPFVYIFLGLTYAEYLRDSIKNDDFTS